MCLMLRALTSALWLIAALALGFEAVAQPCEMNAAPMQNMTSEMPCHDDMMAMAETEAPMPQHDMPNHETPICCCAALLGNGVTADAPEMSQPVPGLTLWAMPMPVSANSILLEYEPPPPRA